MTTFDKATTQKAPAFKKATRVSSRNLTGEDFAIPAKWVVFAVILVTYTILAIIVSGQAREDGNKFVHGLTVAMAWGGAAGCLVYGFMTVKLWGGKISLIHIKEKITGHDINQDGYIGQMPQEKYLTVEIKQGGSSSILPRIQGLDDARFIEFAARLIGGETMARTTWDGFFGKDLEGRDIYPQIRSWMLQRGLAKQKSPGSPTHGLVLTVMGWNACEALADLAVDDAAPLLDVTPPQLTTGTTNTHQHTGGGVG